MKRNFYLISRTDVRYVARHWNQTLNPYQGRAGIGQGLSRGPVPRREQTIATRAAGLADTPSIQDSPSRPPGLDPLDRVTSRQFLVGAAPRARTESDGSGLVRSR